MAIVRSIEDLTESFALMDDWEGQFDLLIALGKQLPEFPEDEKTETNKVKGCVSQVWILPKIEQGIFTFQADSDAFITKGLVALLHLAYNGLPVEKIKDVDIHAIFARLGLDKNLTPQRRNGFYSMVQRIQSAGS